LRLSRSRAALKREYSSLSLHFRFCFLFTTLNAIFALDSEDFIDSFADFGIAVCVFKYFSRKTSPYFLASNFICGRKKSLFTILLISRYVSCLSSKELLFYVRLFMQFRKHIFSLVYARSANVQFKTTARMLLDIDSLFLLNFIGFVCQFCEKFRGTKNKKYKWERFANFVHKKGKHEKQHKKML
jgi:hypothetical protein